MRPRIVDFLNQSGWHWLALLVPTPGMVYTIMFLIATSVLLLRCRRVGIGAETALEAAVAGAVGAAIGTRLFYLITTGEILRLPLLAWFDTSRGTASWGAYVGAAGGFTLYALWKRTSAWQFLDAAASCASLYEVIGRWSCFLAGDDFGRITTVPWAIRYPAGSLPFNAHVARGALSPAAELSLPVHPVQFYLMGNALLVFLVTSAVWRRHRDEPGRTLATFLVLHGSARFWWEFFRDPAAGGASGLLSVSQWTCLGFLASGLLLFAAGRSRLQPRAAHS